MGVVQRLIWSSAWETDAETAYTTGQEVEKIMLALAEGNEAVDELPVGTIVMWAGLTPPAGWLICDGSTIAGDEYPALHAVLGGAYGLVPGFGQSLPDFRGRAPIGVGTGAGLTARARGAKTGTETHVLTVAEMPEHRHEVQARDSSTAGTTNRVMSASATGTNKNTENMMNPAGGGAAHNNMPPALAVNFIIKAV